MALQQRQFVLATEKLHFTGYRTLDVHLVPTYWNIYAQNASSTVISYTDMPVVHRTYMECVCVGAFEYTAILIF